MQRSRTDSKFFQGSYPSLLFESSLPDSDARRSAKLRWLNPFRSIKITTVSQAGTCQRGWLGQLCSQSELFEKPI